MKLRFDQWMDKCLYDPERGYYSRKVKTVGKGGDFTTTPELTSSLGNAIAEWIREEWKRVGRQLPVIELGAGTGVLAEQVRKSLGWKSRLGFQHGIVEVSEGLREAQSERLGHKVRWYSSAQEAVKAYGGNCLIYSNEFVDTFPVRIFQKREEEWLELFLVIHDGRVSEEWERVEMLPESSLFSRDWQEGQRVEVHESYRSYFKEFTSEMKGGAVLTIDYGEELEELYQRRPKGSIRAYFMQERVEGGMIYENMGRQDLTADVNFSDLRKWGEKNDWMNADYKNQHEFLASTPRGNKWDQAVIDPLGAGSAFKILIQRPQKSLI